MPARRIVVMAAHLGLPVGDRGAIWSDAAPLAPGSPPVGPAAAPAAPDG